MRYSIFFPIVVAVVLSSSATFFITKSVCSNSESQVVAYLKEKEARECAEAEKAAYPMGRAAAEKANEQAAEARRRFLAN